MTVLLRQRYGRIIKLDGGLLLAGSHFSGEYQSAGRKVEFVLQFNKFTHTCVFSLWIGFRGGSLSFQTQQETDIGQCSSSQEVTLGWYTRSFLDIV
ncbi:H2.0-like homeobox protein [Biomphalaria glabrata]